MDAVVYGALEEICSQAAKGLALRGLWSKIHSHLSSNGLHLCTNVKKALWSNLLNIPSLQFECKGTSYAAEDPKIQSFEDAEAIDLRIVAAEHLLDSFVGIYDIKASNTGISQRERRALERLAIARTDGVTQNELAKELDIENRNFHNVVRNLETRGLIVRQSVMIRNTEAGNDGDYKVNSIINTNMLHLHRYSKHLGSLQRLEITKEDNPDTGDGVSEEHIKDYAPALKDICDRLEKADGKVLVVADIKKELGYRERSGHRAWRNIKKKLEDAHLVKEFEATVNQKKVRCLRLLKTFSPETYLDTEQQIELVHRGQVTEQLLELPIEQQIYDMIDAEGSKGLISIEIYKRLGIKSKRYSPLIRDMVKRFQMHLDSESLNRGLVYCVWTSGNFKSEVSNSPPGKLQNLMDDKLSTQPQVGHLLLTHTTQEPDHLTSKVNTESSQEQNIDTNGIIVNSEPASNLEITSSSSPAPRVRRSYVTYPCLGRNTASSQREQRILEKLQEEKVLIKPELHRVLNSLENLDKYTNMDRRTLERSLNKLQEDGHCKCISFAIPSVTNCGRKRTVDVILHPSVYKAEDLSDRVLEKIRSFEKLIRTQSFPQHSIRKSKSIPVLNNVERIPINRDVQSETIVAMRENGFALAKMVRAKLLHVFLWSNLTRVSGWDDSISGKDVYEQKNPYNTCKLFELDAAIKAMPLELFLQVAGSPVKLDSMVEKCRNGICLSDLPIPEYRSLMDTRATGRLSYLIDILRRLKLIRLIGGELLETPVGPHTATLRHSLELKPYIEEPVTVVLPSPGVNSYDLRPNVRHDFVLASRKGVDEYWNTLEYCYSASDPKAALHAFPGSAVHEVFLSRAWASVRVMTAHQRAELSKLVANDDSDKKISYRKCEKIAENLNLTLEQVLRVYYDKRQKNKSKGTASTKEQESQPPTNALITYKRKRYSKGKASVNNEKTLMENLLEESSKVKHPKLYHEDNETHTSIDDVDGQKEAVDDVALTEDEDTQSYSVSKLQQSTRSKRFAWTETTDRLLVIEYVRHRASVGAKFHRAEWTSLQNLPAPPETCRRRMSTLNRNNQFRKAIMRLCNMLSLIFLSTAKAPGVPKLLAETLRRYSEHDLFTAFNYLRDKKFMVRGNDASHFVLSQQFLHGISSSPFPVNTGKKAGKMARWIHERESELLEDEVNLPSDMQCGDVVQLCVLMCSGEVSMFPCLPDEGVGEIEELKKRKCDASEMCVEKAKKPKILDSEIFCRKEKGFPGIRLSLNRNLISRIDLITFSRDDNLSPSGDAFSKRNSASESTWEAMTCHARHVASSGQQQCLINPDLFKTVYSAIQKAGDQGLSMEEISNIIDVQGEKIPEIIVEVLEAFGRVIKVNAYDSVHVVDSMYRSKYFLASMGSHQHDLQLKDPNTSIIDENHEKTTEETCTDLVEIPDEVHKVTILNHPEEVPQHLNETNKNNEIENYKKEFCISDYESPCYKPILPWVNGDGSINEIVYKGLVRRALGIVMQNPGILEENIISQMNVLNPQSCRKLLELMILDSQITVRKMYESVSNEPPAMLRGLFGCSFKKSKLVSREHLFANPTSINFL
ncbi:hypothetical protein L2E82_27750 [Cichorium intybus]|uniref:Uncharacterized protein n=1 Tax=Cichorium intybus TaxID=13427 RepID=A0ACB9CTQ3_CICIN|nr:hypothetical protein L2E82_27750 [Cichorium intybus]